MAGFSVKERLRYRFDNFMARGTKSMVLGLAFVSLLIVVAGGTVLAVAGIAREGEAPASWGENVWQALMRAIDSGALGGDSGWGYRIAMSFVTLGGIFIVAALIGVINGGIEARLDTLRKGRSKAVEIGHTVILGWSGEIKSILPELACANANKRDACVVVMAPKDKLEMEDGIADAAGDLKTTRVVCRTGDPSDTVDLEIASLRTSKSIVILSPESANPDAEIVKTLLAIVNNKNRRREPYHIVAKIRDRKYLEVARSVGRDEVELVYVGDLVSRIMAQACRQSGLSLVYKALLSFESDEIYFQEEPALVGKTYGEALLAYGDSSVIGLKQGASCRINPTMDTRILSGDLVIAISEDDDRVCPWPRGAPGIAEAAIAPEGGNPEGRPESTLIVGWNAKVPTILRELDAYVAKGSSALILAEAAPESAILTAAAGLANLSVTSESADPTERDVLRRVLSGKYAQIILLPDERAENPQDADARTLVSLIQLREISRESKTDWSITTEMLDIRNQALAEIGEADDFVVGDNLISLLLAMISENKDLNAVFTDLFDPAGSEIYMKPAERYLTPGMEANFLTVVEAGRRRGESVIGYRIASRAHDAARGFGLRLNPDKAALVRFEPGDVVVTIAEE